jgi:hypothetical protein
LIAGGSVRKSIMGEELGTSDIDIFFKSSRDLTNATKQIVDLGCEVKRHPNCNGVKIYPRNHSIGESDGLYLQLITKECYPNMEELISKFDFTVCQFGYTNGTYFYTNEAMADEKSKQLRYTQFSKQEVNVTRYAKYLTLGYTPTISAFDKIFITGRRKLYGSSESISEADELYGGI